MKIVVIGAGGHARVLIASLRELGKTVVGCIARESPDGLWEPNIPYLGDFSALDALNPAEIGLVNGVGSVASTLNRESVFEQAKALGFDFRPVVHPSVLLLGDVMLGEGVQVMAGAVIQNGARVDRNSLINTGAIVDHDCLIGAHVHIAPGAVLSGGVSVGIGVHVGTGASIIQGVTIGHRAIIGAGSVVIRHVPDGAKVAGVPARRLS